mmetsp:Transcript_42331/g.109789  ORF Transcript_42331/g.109789 Transcript_42331/m.109789 type:complete len:211 (-) Transcript_42331:1172-1804(-)
MRVRRTRARWRRTRHLARTRVRTRARRAKERQRRTHHLARRGRGRTHPLMMGMRAKRTRAKKRRRRTARSRKTPRLVRMTRTTARRPMLGMWMRMSWRRRRRSRPSSRSSRVPTLTSPPDACSGRRALQNSVLLAHRAAQPAESRLNIMQMRLTHGMYGPGQTPCAAGDDAGAPATIACNSLALCPSLPASGASACQPQRGPVACRSRKR